MSLCDWKRSGKGRCVAWSENEKVMMDLEMIQPVVEEEGSLARKAQGGDARAFEALMDRYSERLNYYLSQLCPRIDEAEDLRQETWLRAWQKIHLYDADRPFWPWVTTVARNLAASARGSGEKLKLVQVQAEEWPAPPPRAAGLQERENRQEIWDCVAQELSERAYRAVRLRYAKDMNVREISERMGITKTHVKVILFRARRKLIRSGALERYFKEKE